ncbi:MAG TPA: hypothetical protein VFP55_12485 [Solirubrobacteraceae bacterium]|nr:hypothetical protein [Solirubrobacteraceae bacterium]
MPVRLDVLNPAEAQALLAAILAPDEPREADGAARLCAELGFLPLAIEQADAYLAQADATPAGVPGPAGSHPGISLRLNALAPSWPALDEADPTAWRRHRDTEAPIWTKTAPQSSSGGWPLTRCALARWSLTW